MRLSRLYVGILLASFLLIVTGGQGQQFMTLPYNEHFIAPVVKGVFVDPVPNAPFSATVDVVSEQELSDGTVNVLWRRNKIARDSHGRTYREEGEMVASSFKGEPPRAAIEIYDPVAGRAMLLNPYLMIAHQLEQSTRPVPAPGTVPAGGNTKAGATITSEDLGTKTYENLVLKGVRQSRPGTTDEFWYSPDLSLYVIRTHQEPKVRQTLTVNQIHRSEPDPSMFAIPEGYRVLDPSPAPRGIGSGPGPEQGRVYRAGGGVSTPQVDPAPPVPQVGIYKPDIYRPGGAVSAPRVIHSVDPQYTDEATKAKIQDICIVALIVDTNGMPQNVHVVRPLGKGLDEKAVEAVKQYRFTPAMYDGHPVPVEINIEVNFRLY